MIIKPTLAAVMAAGLIIPAANSPTVPSPAIVKVKNLDFTKNIRLGMPITLGILAASGKLPYYINANNGASSASATSISWTHTTTADTTCLIVGGFSGDNGTTVTISGVTFNGVSLTQVQRGGGAAQGSSGMWVLLNPPIGAYTVIVTCGSLANRGLDGMSANFGGVTQVNASGITTVTTSNPITTAITSTELGIAVGMTHTNIVGGGTVSYTYNSPTGMALVAQQSYLSNSNRKNSALSTSTTLVSTGSSTLSVTSSASPSGQSQVYAILT